MKHDGSRTRSERMAMYVAPARLDRVIRERQAWYETREEIEAGVEWGRIKCRLLQWVRLRMDMHMTPQERRCLELYYFFGLTVREIGEDTKLTNSAIHASLRRCVHRLRTMAKREGVSYDVMRTRLGKPRR